MCDTAWLIRPLKSNPDYDESTIRCKSHCYCGCGDLEESDYSKGLCEAGKHTNNECSPEIFFEFGNDDDANVDGDYKCLHEDICHFETDWIKAG